MDDLLADLRECGDHPLDYGQETHGELHLEARRELVRVTRERDALLGVESSLKAVVDFLGGRYSVHAREALAAAATARES